MLLFKVQPKHSQPVYFSDKRLAKVYRDELREAGSKDELIIMRGPDHRRGESFNISKQTPSSRRERR